MAQAETTAAEGVRRPVGRPRSQGERYSEALVIKMTPRQLATILALVERDAWRTAIRPCRLFRSSGSSG
jgi:hypothetical protein